MNIELYQAYSFCQQGQRDYQEDSRFPDAEMPNPGQRFFVVCDGVGGCDKGEIASQTVCESFGKSMKEQNLAHDFTNESFAHVLDRAYNALDSKANDENREMATTLTFVCFHEGGCTMAHIGDSRIYQIRPSEGVLYRSDDHSMVNSMVHNGVLTPEQGINHSQGNVITRYMEPTDSAQDRCMATVMRTKDIQAGDYFFLCSDGVLKCVSDDELMDILSTDDSDERKMQKIAQMSQDSEDNNTAYLIRVRKVETDLVTAAETEMMDGDTHQTKKIKVASQSFDEVESVEAVSRSVLYNLLSKLLKKIGYMKKMIMMVAFLAVTCSHVYCAQPSKKEIKKAVVDSIAVVMEKAKAGDAAAQNTVGVWYYTGKGTIQQDYKQAMQWWARSAKQGNADAIGNMAMCYQLGRGIEKDSAMSIKLYETAIKKGNKNIIPQHEAIVKNTNSIFSCLLLRDCYIKGIGVKRDEKQAANYQEIAAKAGHVDSQFALGLNCLNKKQADKAADWFKKAASQGNVGATYYYGYLLLNGMGVNQDKEAAASYLKRASEKGFPMADYQLGIMYREGNGVDKNAETAFEYVKKAAFKGNADAKWMLGNMYLKGDGVSQDYYLAAQWLAEVALSTHKKEINNLLKEDNEGPFSQYLMGLRKYYVDKDYASAITYFTKVDKAKNPEGKTMLGMCYANKDYAKQNLKKAIKNLTKAIEGSKVANYYLAAMYETGTGVEKDNKKAVELLKKAADAGIAYAECRLGDRYMTGNGVSKDMTKAALLYLDAEAQNHLTPQSAKNLAECYKNKLSVLADLQDADKRIEQLNKQKGNNNLTNLLKLLEK